MSDLDYSSIPQGTSCRGYTLSGEFWIDASGYKMDRKALHPALEGLKPIELPEHITTNEEVREWLVEIQPPEARQEMRKALESDKIPIPDIEGEWIAGVQASAKEKERMLVEYLREIGRGSRDENIPSESINEE